MKTKFYKHIAIIVSLALAVSVLPMSAFAEEGSSQILPEDTQLGVDTSDQADENVEEKSDELDENAQLDEGSLEEGTLVEPEEESDVSVLEELETAPSTNDEPEEVVAQNEATTPKSTTEPKAKTKAEPKAETKTEPKAESKKAEPKTTPVLNYQTHVQGIGWQKSVKGGSTAGTSGQSRRVEAIKISLSNSGYTGGISYQTHVQSIGWQGKKTDGAVSGTTGKKLRIEAIKISLTGEIAKHYDVYYRVHIQNIGWLNWASNGAGAGTEAASLRMEAIQIKLVKKGAQAPSGSGIAYFPKSTVEYKSHVQSIGWQAAQANGALSGTTGKAKRVEAVSMSLNSAISGGISYNAHVQNIGWQGSKSNGDIAGTTGQKLRIEAITVSLTGDIAKYYDVYYRVYVQDYGWLGWTKNGAKAGTSGIQYRLEALQVKVLVKGATSAPGLTSEAYKNTPKIPASFKQMNSRVSGKSSGTQWLIAIDTRNNIFGVYRGRRGNWTNIHMWDCATGLSTSPTVKGTFRVGSKGYSFGSYYTCYYWTQFYNDYLIHSIKYYPGTRRVLDPAMGRPASAGCVRLWIENAKWVQDNIPAGSTVYVY